MLVLHADDETIEARIGMFRYSIPSKEAVEIPDPYIGFQLLQRFNYAALVEVKQIRGPRGVTYDVDSAIKESEALLKIKDEEQIREYVNAQYEDRTKNGKVALPPARGSRIERLLKKYEVNLKRDYNLDVSSASQAEIKQVNNQRDADIDELKTRNARLEQMVELLLARSGTPIPELPAER